MSRRRNSPSGAPESRRFKIVCNHSGTDVVLDRFTVDLASWQNYLRNPDWANATVERGGKTSSIRTHSALAGHWHRRSVDQVGEPAPTPKGVVSTKFRIVCQRCPRSKGADSDVALSWENFDLVVAAAYMSGDTTLRLHDLPVQAARLRSNSPHD